MNKRYEKYKGSEVEWIGEIPEHWELKKIKGNCNIISGYPFDSELFNHTKGFPIVRIRDITNNYVQTYYNGLIVNSALIDNGDILVGMDGDFNICHWTGGKALLNQRLCCIRGSGNTKKMFLYYLLPIPLNIINDLKYYTTVKHLSIKDLEQLYIAFPTENEQDIIIKYLTEKTSEIDSLIADKEELINRLEEYKQSIITEAVTKGLNLDVKMKDSGIQWIGEIPEHWEIKRLKDFSSIARGTVDKAIKENEITVYLVQYTNVYYKSVQRENDSDYLPITVTENELQNSKVNKGDILLTASSETPDDIGRSTVIFEDLSNHVFGSDILRIRIPEKIMAFNYKKYLFENQIYLHKMNSLCRGVTRFRFGMNDFKTIRYLIPPIDEQKHIADHLDGLMIDIDLSIDHINKQLNLVKSYRQSLIYEAVTGKIDVRDYQSERSEQFA